jgi:hypothetical protein
MQNLDTAIHERASHVPWNKGKLLGVPDNTAIRAASVGLDRKYRIGPEILRDALAASNQGNAHLSSHRQLTRGPIALGTHQNREHSALPRHRGRRCTRHSLAG